MKLPLDLYGQDMMKWLARYSYEIHHQTGSHIIVRTQEEGEHSVSIPNHKPLKIGTLSTVLADYLHIKKTDLLERLMARRG